MVPTPPAMAPPPPKAGDDDESSELSASQGDMAEAGPPQKRLRPQTRRRLVHPQKRQRPKTRPRLVHPKKKLQARRRPRHPKQRGKAEDEAKDEAEGDPPSRRATSSRTVDSRRVVVGGSRW